MCCCMLAVKDIKALTVNHERVTIIKYVKEYFWLLSNGEGTFEALHLQPS